MKKWLISLFVMLALVGCGKEPKSVVEAYYGNLDKGEITASYQLMSQQLVGKAGEQKVRAMLQEQAKKMQAKGGIATMAVEGEAKGEIGEYTVHIVFKDGTKEDGKVSVEKEDDGWKIAPGRGLGF